MPRVPPLVPGPFSELSGHREASQGFWAQGSGGLALLTCESRAERVPSRSGSALGNRDHSDSEGRGGALMRSGCRAGNWPGLQTPLRVLPGTATSPARQLAVGTSPLHL